MEAAMSCPCTLCFVFRHSIYTTQTHGLHHNAVVVMGQAALAACPDVVRLMRDRTLHCTNNASAVSCHFVCLFQDLDVCETNSLKLAPALDHFVHREVCSGDPA